MSKPVTFGVLGCAGIARKNIRAYRKTSSVELKAVASRSLEKAKAFVEETAPNSGVRAYGTYQELIDDPEIEVLYIPLPTSLHLEWVPKAAAKGKHILLEKPPALNVAELDTILKACRDANVRLMDGTMWVHNPRTVALRNALSDKERFGEFRHINTSFFFYAGDQFLAEDIRVKPDLDSLGALGDLGWYCIRASLWARNYELPFKVVGHLDPKYNALGVLLRCGATLYWRDGVFANFDCGFETFLHQALDFVGTHGQIRLDDFVVPQRESVSSFELYHSSSLQEDATKFQITKTVHDVSLPVPQETSMAEEMARIVRLHREGKGDHEEGGRWEEYSRKTQLVIDAVLRSIKEGGSVVTLE